MQDKELFGATLDWVVEKRSAVETGSIVTTNGLATDAIQADSEDPSTACYSDGKGRDYL